MNVDTVVDVASGALVVAGAFLAAVGALGVVRLPDVFGRMHAATKPPTLGLVLVAVGAALQLRDVTEITVLVLVVGLQFLTAPVGAHLVGRAAHGAGGLADPDTVRDDLAEHDRTDPE